MASKNKVIEMIASIKTIYPYYAKETNVETLVRTWCILLKDIPDNITEAAFYKCLQVCKMPPTPADVLEQVRMATEAAEPSSEELWSVFTKTLREVETQVYRIKYPLYGEDPRQKIAEAWEALPERVRQYVGSKGELMRMSGMTADELKFEKNRFLKTLPQIAARQEFTELSRLIGAGDKMLLE